MSDLMFDIMMWVLLILAIAFSIYLLCLIVYGIQNLMTNATKKELKLKKYRIRYINNEIKGELYVEAKNEKQAKQEAKKEFRRYYSYITDVKEVE